jgi:hypothetical protein
VRDLVTALRHTSWVKAATMYTLRDQTSTYQFGLLDQAGDPKPAFTAARRTFSSRASTLRRATLRLGRAGKHLVASGTGSIADLYMLRVYRGSQLRYRAYVRTSRFGTYRVALPAALGTSGLRVRVSSDWSGRSVTRRR